MDLRAIADEHGVDPAVVLAAYEQVRSEYDDERRLKLQHLGIEEVLGELDRRARDSLVSTGSAAGGDRAGPAAGVLLDRMDRYLTDRTRARLGASRGGSDGS